MRLPSRRTFLTWGAGGLSVAALAGLALAPEPVLVDLETVQRGPLQVTLDHEGQARVHDRFLVSAPVAGRVRRIELRPGDPVVAGRTVVARFEPSFPVLLDARSRAETRARVSATRAAFAQARSQRDEAATQARLAASELTRQQRLAGEGLVAPRDLETAQAAARARQEGLAAAESAAAAARHELEAAQAALLEPGEAGRAAHTLALRSPVDGVVLQRLHESEAVVPAGEPLLEIGDRAELEIVSDYLSTEAVRIQPGQRVSIERWGGDRPLTGRVRRVEPHAFMKVSALGVEEQRANVVVDLLELPAPGQALGDGYRVETRVVTWESANVLQVPASALFRHGQGWAVFVAEAGRARLRAVGVGHRNGLAAEVLQGLSAGERVLAHPSDAVSDGVRVRDRRT